MRMLAGLYSHSREYRRTEYVCQVLGGVRFGANTCRACTRTCTNTGKVLANCLCIGFLPGCIPLPLSPQAKFSAYDLLTYFLQRGAGQLPRQIPSHFYLQLNRFLIGAWERQQISGLKRCWNQLGSFLTGERAPDSAQKCTSTKNALLRTFWRSYWRKPIF